MVEVQSLSDMALERMGISEGEKVSLALRTQVLDTWLILACISKPLATTLSPVTELVPSLDPTRRYHLPSHHPSL